MTFFKYIGVMALGAILGIGGYKKLRPAPLPPMPVCQIAEDVKREVETRTVIRYVDKAGQPVTKETIVTNTEQKATKPLPIPRPKNIIGISSRITPNGGNKFGPTYGRELFPNFYVTGSVLFDPKDKKQPELLLGIQLLF